MEPKLLLLLLFSFFISLFSKEIHPPRSSSSSSSSSKLTVIGFVYCDICSNNTFSRHSYFLPGVKVHINCKFNAASASTTEQINFSVNRTTDKYGMYKLDIPSVDGIKCAEGVSVKSFCQATLIGNPSSSCNVPGLQTTSDQMAFKSKHENLCFYSLNALNYRPSSRDVKLCGEHKEVSHTDPLKSEKFFFPFFPPFSCPWPQFPPMPPFPSFPFPQLPPFPSFPFPPLPPFPFPPLPPYPGFQFPPVSFPKPPPPPLTTFPFPPLPPLPPLFSPPPPAFNLLDPRTWLPFFPPSPTTTQLQNQHP